MKNYTIKNFGIDGEFYARGITFGQRWNGFECPYFELYETLQILSKQDTKQECEDVDVSFYEISADGLHIIETNSSGLYVSDSVLVDGERYFPIGGFNWVWEEIIQQID